MKVEETLFKILCDTNVVPNDHSAASAKQGKIYW